MHKACWLRDEKQLNNVGNVDKAENKKDSHDNGRHIEVASLTSSSSQQSLGPLVSIDGFREPKSTRSVTTGRQGNSLKATRNDIIITRFLKTAQPVETTTNKNAPIVQGSTHATIITNRVSSSGNSRNQLNAPRMSTNSTTPATTTLTNTAGPSSSTSISLGKKPVEYLL